jgi:hypothetical protein
MRVRLLTVLALIGMVLAPFLPSQRLYVCQVTGEVRSTCCCQLDQKQLSDGDTSGCCTVVVIHQFTAPPHVLAVPASSYDVVTAIAVPGAPCLAILWDGKPLVLHVMHTPLRPPDPLFVRHCALLI